MSPIRATGSNRPSNGPTPNPHLLLNPRAKVGSKLQDTTSKPPPASNGSESSVNGHNDSAPLTSMGSMLERIHGVGDREERPQKKLKTSEADENAVSERKTFGSMQSGGEISEWMKKERRQALPGAQPRVNEVIDLESEDYTRGQKEDDDVIITGENRLKGTVTKPEVDGDAEVCLGRVEGARVMAHRIPAPKLSAFQGSQTMWPAMKLTLHKRPGTAGAQIGVWDPQDREFGHIDPKVAPVLVQLMNSADLKLRASARLDQRRRQPFEHPGQSISDHFAITLTLYAQRKYAKGIGKLLSQRQIWLRDPTLLERGMEVCNPHGTIDFAPKKKEPVGSGPGSKSTSVGFLQRTNEEMRQDVMNVFDALAETKDLPEKDTPSLIKTPLLQHQKQALHFMTEREKDHVVTSEIASPGKSIWQQRFRNNGKQFWFNVISGHEFNERPSPCLGGILADVMGLGKTLNVLSLIAATTEEAEAFGQKQPDSSEDDDDDDDGPQFHSRATLVVCPLSTIVNWEDQIRNHIGKEVLQYYIYQGPKRTDDPEELLDQDVVITTYNTISVDCDSKSRKRGPGPNPLARINWFRIVLDEAHSIRTQNTRTSKATCALNAQRRWCVTGTPVQNRLDDLGALIKFLRIKPFDEPGNFAQYITAPLKSADVDAIPRLRLLVDSITLRRSKDRISLPGRIDKVVKLEMSVEERDLYDQFNRDSRRNIEAMTNKNNTLSGRAYAHVLKAILRLRLLSAHGGDLLSDADWDLAKGFSASHAIDLEDSDDDRPDRLPKQAFEMYRMMRDANVHFCAKCNKYLPPAEDTPDEDISDDDSDDEDSDTIGFLTPCNHLLCTKCVKGYRKEMQSLAILDNRAKCTVCTTYIRFSLFELKHSEINADEEAMEKISKSNLGKHISRYSGPHTKTKELVAHLENHQAWSDQHPAEAPIKAVVFSEWTAHLNLIQMALTERKVPFCRLDGSMPKRKRDETLRTFDEPHGANVILVSLKAGGLGLNLTAASKVYVMEPNYNPAAERQAVERVHRLGQTREVTIRRFIMKNSIEEQIVELQRKKENLAAFSLEKGSFKREDKAEASRKRLEDLKSLFR